MIKKWLLLILTSCTVYAQDNPTVVVSPGNKQVMIALKANAGTGYVWSLTFYDKNILTLQDTKWIQPNQSLVGGSGYMQFKFQVNSVHLPKKTVLTFDFGRPWEASNLHKLQYVTVNFTSGKMEKNDVNE